MDQSQRILSDITVFQKYAKHLEQAARRENWLDLCERNAAMHIRKYPHLREEIARIYREFVVPRKVLPSMRSMQFAGAPIELSNNRMFNCAYLAVNHPAAFWETMFLLLGGCFRAGTMVTTKEGPKRIEDITTSDLVLTFDEETKTFDWVHPVWSGKTPTKSKQKVKVTTSSGEEILTTADHKFLTDNRGWVEAKNLTTEDRIISS